MLLAVMVWALAVTPLPLSAAPLGQSSSDGKTIFEQKCASCHTIGGGKRVGPDLKGVTQRRDRDWLMRWIAEPDKMLAEGDPTAKKLLAEYNNVPMPNLGLSKAEVAAVVAYLESTGGAQGAGGAKAPVPAAAPPQPSPVSQGDATRGRALFMGEQPLQNGGPACRSCHTLSALGVPGGGTLGPKLDGVVQRYNGADALYAWLQSPPTEVMRAVWADHPISKQDRADLVVFLQNAPTGAAASSTTLILLVLGFALFIIFLVVIQLAWHHRLRGVRRAIITRA